jgi:hypothetical protein
LCKKVEEYAHCASWCNSYTCGLSSSCAGCNFCSPPAGQPCECIGNGGAAAGSTYAETIGNTCAAHDGAESYCKEGGSSFGSDWCADTFCYVDPTTCDKPSYKSSYFPGADLYFSYQGCDPEGFSGNSWVGFCECVGNQGAPPGTGQHQYGVNMGGAVTGTEAVRGCSAWDGQESYCQAAVGDIGGTYHYGASGPADWCSDEWCYVNKDKCDVNAYKSSYFPGYDLHFAYKKCDATFTGNGWVGDPEGTAVTPSNA